jgi:uncharacterized protein (DUF1015 family)
MAEVRVFQGWRYDLGKASAAEALVSPPYDVIGPDQASALRERSPHNVIHLELPEGSEDAAAPDNRYTRAAQRFREWRDQGILRREEQPALYLYSQEFTLPNRQRLRRLGILAALRLEPYERGIVLPHERTFAKHKEDRYRLLAAAQAQFSPIMGLYAAEDVAVREHLEAITAAPPALSAEGEGVVHSLWVCREESVWSRDLLATRQVFIADGHHRYETALRYQAGQQGSGAGNWWYDYVLTYLVAMEDPGLALLPTHRLVRGLSREAAADLAGRLARSERFVLREVAAPQVALPPGHLRMLTPEGAAIDLFLPGENSLASEEGRPEAWANQEAVILQELVLKRSLEAGPELEVVYTRDAEEARRRVASGEFQAAFLLPPPRMEQLRAIALAGQRMPEKTTYFWPKAWAGLVVYGDGAIKSGD